LPGRSAKLAGIERAITRKADLESRGCSQNDSKGKQDSRTAQNDELEAGAEEGRRREFSRKAGLTATNFAQKQVRHVRIYRKESLESLKSGQRTPEAYKRRAQRFAQSQAIDRYHFQSKSTSESARESLEFSGILQQH
jgi:hypothetical protein